MSVFSWASPQLLGTPKRPPVLRSPQLSRHHVSHSGRGNVGWTLNTYRPAQSLGLSLLGLGDVGERAQQMVLPRMGQVSVDVVKVSHHGSADQLPALYDSISASIGLIGVGADNRYGHPTDTTLQMLHSVGTTPLRSDERGTLTLHRGEGGIESWSTRGG